MVFVKRSGLLVACAAERLTDGVAWHCPRCEFVVIRASFGVLNGTLHCPCGAEVELCVDGRAVDVSQLNVLPGAPPEPRNSCNAQCGCHNCPECECHKAAVTNDDEFLRECGIAIGEDEK